MRGGQYISVKQNGRILKFNANGFIDSMSIVQYPVMKSLYIREVREEYFIFSPIDGQGDNLFYDTLILIKSNLLGITQSVYKYYQKDGLIFYDGLMPLTSGGYELHFLTRTDSTATLSYNQYKTIKLDNNLNELLVNDMDTTLLNKYKGGYYFFTFLTRIKNGLATLEHVISSEPSVGSNYTRGFAICIFNENWGLINRVTITDSIIKANSKEYKSFDVRSWLVDVVKTTKDSGLIIAGHYQVGMFPYESLPFLIKTDTAGNVVWLDAGLGDFPAGAQEKRPVTEHLVLYPNPANDQIVITTQEAPSTIDVMDLNGKVLINRFTSLQQTVIDIQHLPTGIYFVKIINQNGVAVKRMMKTD